MFFSKRNGGQGSLPESPRPSSWSESLESSDASKLVRAYYGCNIASDDDCEDDSRAQPVPQASSIHASDADPDATEKEMISKETNNDMEDYDVYSGLGLRQQKDWKHGMVFRYFWSELSKSSKSINPEYHCAIRTCVVISSAKGSSLCLPITIHGTDFRFGKKPAADPLNFGMIVNYRDKQKASSRVLGFPPLQMVVLPTGDPLSKGSHVNYSFDEIMTFEHSCRIFVMGMVRVEEDLGSAVFKCWTRMQRSLGCPRSDFRTFWRILQHKHTPMKTLERTESDSKQSGSAKGKSPASLQPVVDHFSQQQEEGYEQADEEEEDICHTREGADSPEQGGDIYEQSVERYMYGPSVQGYMDEHGEESYQFEQVVQSASQNRPVPDDPNSSESAWNGEATPEDQVVTFRGNGRRRQSPSSTPPSETKPVGFYQYALPLAGAWALGYFSKSSIPTSSLEIAPPPNPTGSRPTVRDDFTVAFICALPLEKSAVQAMFDSDWDDEDDQDEAPWYGTERADPIAYSHGRIGRHNVVVASTGGMGKLQASTAATHIRYTWPRVELILVVGICGAVPFPSTGEEIILGDVVISSGVIQYDFGRQTDSGFVIKRGVQDMLPLPGPKLSSLLRKLQDGRDHERLHRRFSQNLERLEKKRRLKAAYLGASHDVLFRGDVPHVLQGMTCDEAGCDGEVFRQRLSDFAGSRPMPAIHIGIVGSADMVMKSGTERDRIAEEDDVIAFEMEGAGVCSDKPWLVIKGVCDYADGHKTKGWQKHAAAAAAACAAAFLREW